MVAIPAGFEPATIGLEGRCSIQLSYGTQYPGDTHKSPSIMIQCVQGVLRSYAKFSA